jgi:hypothetical protein
MVRRNGKTCHICHPPLCGGRVGTCGSWQHIMASAPSSSGRAAQGPRPNAQFPRARSAPAAPPWPAPWPQREPPLLTARAWSWPQRYALALARSLVRSSLHREPGSAPLEALPAVDKVIPYAFWPSNERPATLIRSGFRRRFCYLS